MVAGLLLLAAALYMRHKLYLLRLRTATTNAVLQYASITTAATELQIGGWVTAYAENL